MVKRLLALSGLLALGWLLLGASPAGAVINGPCDAGANLDGEDVDAVVDVNTAGRVTIPREANVTYQGSISIPNPSEDMPYSGHVNLDVAPLLDIIPGLDDPTIASWSWGGDTDSTSTQGNTDYDLDLPAGLGGGIDFTATGSHTQAGVTCTGSLDGEIEGSVVNPASVASAVLTALGGAGLGFAALGKP